MLNILDYFIVFSLFCNDLRPPHQNNFLATGQRRLEIKHLPLQKLRCTAIYLWAKIPVKLDQHYWDSRYKFLIVRGAGGRGDLDQGYGAQGRVADSFPHAISATAITVPATEIVLNCGRKMYKSQFEFIIFSICKQLGRAMLDQHPMQHKQLELPSLHTASPVQTPLLHSSKIVCNVSVIPNPPIHTPIFFFSCAQLILPSTKVSCDTQVPNSHSFLGHNQDMVLQFVQEYI